MEPPSNDGLFVWVIDHAWIAIVALIGVVWRQNEKIQKSNEDALAAHKTASAKALEEHKMLNSKMHDDTHDELKLQRGYIGELFKAAELSRKEFSNQLSQHREDSFNRHIELMNAINGKADK